MHWCEKGARRPLLSEGKQTPSKGDRGRYRSNSNKHSTADIALKVTHPSGGESDSDDEGQGDGVMEPKGLLLKAQKVWLLLWKNLLFRRRHYIVTALEVILPTLMALLIAYIRTEVPSENSLGSISVDSDTVYPLVSEEDSLTHAAQVLSKGRHDSSNFSAILAFTPRTDLTLRIMAKAEEYLVGSTFELKGFGSEKEIELYMARSRLSNSSATESDKIRAVVVFQGNDNWRNLPGGGALSYKIRLVDVYAMENTDALFPLFQHPGPDPTNVVNYENSGFTGLQIAIDKALIQSVTGKEAIQQINTQAFPYPPHTQAFNFNMIYFWVLPRFMVIGFIFIVPSIIRNVVSEKETGIKELMKMMGLPNWMHWLGWMLNSLLLLSISISLVIILFFVPFDAAKGPVILYGNWTLWWVVFFLFAMASTAFFFLISTFFQRPTLATTFGIVIYLLTYFGPIESLERKYQFLSLTQKLAPALFPNVALHWAIKVMCGFEGKSVGSRWGNLFDTVNSVDELSLGHICLMLIFDTVLYMALTIYFENVIPSEYGLRKPWYYFFQFSKWRRAESKCSNSSIVSCDRRGFEPEPLELNAGIVITNLRKQFGSNKVAVDMSGTLKMYDGQITALLGHNGAGKTTTLSILTGLFGPTSGTARVNGYDIREDMDKVRMNLGLCPQHNMLFAKLTVEEHLVFFGRLKGLSKAEALAEVKSLLEKLQLSEKRSTLAEALSGGQKRKLCLGMALIGGTKVVILDEPTSGMDPEARRAIWDLLLGMRGERTIVLTTHFMEEADVLGDRIAIMAAGQVKCCGTPNFLKKFYGAGYTLKLTVDDPAVVSTILDLVQSWIPESSLRKGLSGGGTQIDITVPNEGNANAKFPSLFAALAECKETLGIQTVGLSLATMDDIFVKVGEESGVEEHEFKTEDIELKETASLQNGTNQSKKLYDGERLTGLRLLCQQFNGIFRKRMLSTLRKRKLCISQFLMPLGLLIVCILLSNTSFSPDYSSPPLEMDISTYKNPVTMFAATSQELRSAYEGAAGKSVSVANVTAELLTIGREDVGAYREKYIVAGDLSEGSVNALFSSIPFHASPLSVNLVSNAILRSMTPSKGYHIKVTSHPISSGLHTLLEAANPNPVFATVVPVLFGVLLPIGLALLAASFIVSPVEEKLCKVKQLQLMTGVSPSIFWGASFLWDFVLMFLLICVMLLTLLIFQTHGVFTAYHGGGVMFLILLLYGFAAISFSYVVSTFVGTVPGGFSLVATIHILTGILLSLTVYMLETFGLSDKVATARSVGRFFPTFGASVAIMRFTAIATRNSRCNILSDDVKNLICQPNVDVQPDQRQCCPNCASFENPTGPNCFKPEAYLTWTSEITGSFDPGAEKVIPGIGQDLLYLFLIGIFYKLILLLIEYGVIQRIIGAIFKTNPSIFAKNNSEDEDVMLEKQRVAALVSTGRMDEDALVVDNLCKSYGSFAAVSGLSFGVHHGECFGLLGVNGAGKTTSFRMLTGDEFRSFGNAFCSGLSLERKRANFLSLIGYCPQFDGILPVLTGKEMVDLFGRLRGIPLGSVEVESKKWLAKLGLLESRNVQCQKYSGGMKRRLCAAIALVGDSPIILLDEPTSGVDPIARRQFWKVIESVRESGQAVVLTSHSMEECEALCSRLGIMVNGSFQCLGGVQHLKSKFAQGFRLVVTLRDSCQEDEVTGFTDRVIQTFNPCFLREKHQRMLEFQVAGHGLGWGELFERMEGLKGGSAHLVDDYSITETTLEEVFLSFARMQYPEREVNVSCFKKVITCHCCK